MYKKNIDHIDTLSKLAKVYGELGHKEECTKIILQMMDECFEIDKEIYMKDKTLIYELIKQKNSKDKALSKDAEYFLAWLKSKGVPM